MQKGCDKEIEWYQSVKETQGSVEVTSYGQMNNIYRYGSYTIGSCMKGCPHQPVTGDSSRTD